MIDWDGVRTALAATRPYLLSHHQPGEWDRCYAPRVGGRRVRLCARCLGIYPGILAGLLAALIGSPLPTGLWVVTLLPMPALVDWAVSAFTARRGWNPVRTATGFGLGYAYGVGLATLYLTGDLRVLAIGVVYGLLAGFLLFVRHARQ
ncbi:DUF2085 domain-containing protein [Natronomonas salina]|uniref:DUF2085 domain-containing protein n=1 Tax=Natronomonas salina TaxID=1710540 RepID=UPI0015B53095|nr:DUF2085 domain-containing protein [Natronomonas salina]QLD89211.1 DUF2085 domain-containing protein [Natronomonas salina]